MNVTGLYWWSVNVNIVISSGNDLASHYLSQCWPRSMLPYGITIGPNELTHRPLGDVGVISKVSSTNTCFGLQYGKLNFWNICPKTDVPCMFWVKFHLPRPIFYSPSTKFTHIGKRYVLVSIIGWSPWTLLVCVSIHQHPNRVFYVLVCVFLFVCCPLFTNNLYWLRLAVTRQLLYNQIIALKWK